MLTPRDDRNKNIKDATWFKLLNGTLRRSSPEEYIKTKVKKPDAKILAYINDEIITQDPAVLTEILSNNSDDKEKIKFVYAKVSDPSDLLTFDCSQGISIQSVSIADKNKSQKDNNQEMEEKSI